MPLHSHFKRNASMLLASADKNKSPDIASSNAFLAQRLRISSTALIRLTFGQCRLLFNAVKCPQKQPAHRKRTHKPNSVPNKNMTQFTHRVLRIGATAGRNPYDGIKSVFQTARRFRAYTTCPSISVLKTIRELK